MILTGACPECGQVSSTTDGVWPFCDVSHEQRWRRERDVLVPDGDVAYTDEDQARRAPRKEW